jgi:hypothetical protein
VQLLRRIAFAVCTLSLAAATACQDSTEPEGIDPDFSGALTLQNINAIPLPYVTATAINGGGTRIASNTITVLSRNRLREVTVYEYFLADGSVNSSARDSAEFAYFREEDRIVIWRPQPFEPNSYADTAEVVGSGFIGMTRKLKLDLPVPPSGRYSVVYVGR